jgi:hypothetical protein
MAVARRSYVLINGGGWLLLTIILLVQRTEKKRRNVVIVVLLAAWSVVWGFGIYRISNACSQLVAEACFISAPQQSSLAWNTTNMAAIAALVLNWLFWFLIGRYNPPRSSDAIKVLGMND